MSKRFVLFDFDGVIADSFSAAFETANQHCSNRTEETYRKQFEGNIYDSKHDFETGDHTKCNHDLNWWETFVPIFEAKATMFDGMEKVIRHLAADHTLIIVSSSIHRAILSMLEKYKVMDCFTEIYDSAMHTSKSEKIGMIFEKYGATPKNSVMITDSKGDVLEAREKAVEAIAVTWGFNNRETLMTAEPFRIIELPDEIPNAVAEFYKGKGTTA